MTAMFFRGASPIGLPSVPQTAVVPASQQAVGEGLACAAQRRAAHRVGAIRQRSGERAVSAVHHRPTSTRRSLLRRLRRSPAVSRVAHSVPAYRSTRPGPEGHYLAVSGSCSCDRERCVRDSARDVRLRGERQAGAVPRQLDVSVPDNVAASVLTVSGSQRRSGITVTAGRSRCSGRFRQRHSVLVLLRPAGGDRPCRRSRAQRFRMRVCRQYTPYAAARDGQVYQPGDSAIAG